ncbi:MAG: hypothetical protein ACXWCZ_03205 [Flavisolibacter sp.]
MKGLRVVTCPWRTPEISVQQVKDMVDFRKHSTAEMRKYFYGVVQTVWSGTGRFMSDFYNKKPSVTTPPNKTPEASFKAMFEEVLKLDK